MQFSNPFKKEKPAEPAPEAPRIEPQLAGSDEAPAPWEVREEQPAFTVVGEGKPLEPEAEAENVMPAPEAEPREPVFFEPKTPQGVEPESEEVREPAAPEARIVLGDTGSAPAPEAPRRPEPEPEADAKAEEKPAEEKKSGFHLPGFGFMKRKPVPEYEEEIPDEAILLQRQRARYKLVGAAALMLAAIVVAPVLLDKEQDSKPPVTTEIPGVPEKARTTLEAVPGTSGDVDVTAVNAEKDQSTSKANLANEARQPVKAEPASQPKVEAKADAKVDAKAPAVKPSAKPQPGKAEAKPAAKTTLAPDAKGFYVQVLATSSERNADKLVKELSAKGYAAYKAPLNRKAGTLWRVRVGNFATREEARGVQGMLVLDGQTGKLIVGNQ